MAAGRDYDFTLGHKGFLLQRPPGFRGRAWVRRGLADSLSPERTAADVRRGGLNPEIDFARTYDDWTGGAFFAHREPAHPNTYHYGVGAEARFPRALTHAQQLRPVTDASTHQNITFFYDVPLPGVASPPPGAGAVLAGGRGFVVSYTPRLAASFDRLYEATGGGTAEFQSPATFGSFTYVGVRSGNFYRRGHDGTTWTQSALPGQRFVNAASRLWRSHADYLVQGVAVGKDPMGSGDYSATLPVGDGRMPIGAAVELDEQLFFGLPDGLYASDVTATYANGLVGYNHRKHPDTGRDLATYGNSVVLPHADGLVQYLPSGDTALARDMGPETVPGVNRSPVRGQPRAVESVGRWLLAGYWTGSQSHILAGQDRGDRWVWHTQQQLPHGRIGRLHVDGITTSSGGTALPQRVWAATDGSLTGTGPLYVLPIPRGHGSPLDADTAFSASYVGSMRLDFGRDNWGVPGVRKVYRELEVVTDANTLLSGVRYADLYYRVDGGSRTLLGRAQDSPKSVLYFPGEGETFVSGFDIELSLESFTLSQNTAPVYREFVVRGALRPERVDEITAVVRIADGLRTRRGTEVRRSGASMLSELRAMADGASPKLLVDLAGATQWVLVRQGVDEEEVYQQGDEAPEIAATVRMSVLDFTANLGGKPLVWSNLAALTPA